MIDRATFKQIKHFDREETDRFCHRLTKAGFENGIRAGSMCLYKALHEEFGWGNARIERLFDRQASLLDDMQKSKQGMEYINKMQDELVAAKIECLRDNAPEQAEKGLI